MTAPNKQDTKILLRDTSRAIENYLEVYEALETLTKEIDDLIGQSDGVAGLHQNGDLAPWDELLDGGRYPWIASHDEAKKLIEKIEREW